MFDVVGLTHETASYWQRLFARMRWDVSAIAVAQNASATQVRPWAFKWLTPTLKREAATSSKLLPPTSVMETAISYEAPLFTCAQVLAAAGEQMQTLQPHLACAGRLRDKSQDAERSHRGTGTAQSDQLRLHATAVDQ